MIHEGYRGLLDMLNFYLEYFGTDKIFDKYFNLLLSTKLKIEDDILLSSDLDYLIDKLNEFKEDAKINALYKVIVQYRPDLLSENMVQINRLKKLTPEIRSFIKECYLKSPEKFCRIITFDHARILRLKPNEIRADCDVVRFILHGYPIASTEMSAYELNEIFSKASENKKLKKSLIKLIESYAENPDTEANELLENRMVDFYKKFRNLILPFFLILTSGAKNPGNLLRSMPAIFLKHMKYFGLDTNITYDEIKKYTIASIDTYPRFKV